MNIDQSNINLFLNKYIGFVDEISKSFLYDNNIKHLLYLIVPAFVYKYGISNESLVLNCFKNVRVVVLNQDNKNVFASFNRGLKKNDDKYYTNKYISIYNYKNNKLTMLIDNIVHEFNHAINSLNNEIFLNDSYVLVRSGISSSYYDKNLKFVKKSKDIYLEEVINTAQTEEIIDIINSFGRYSIDNVEFTNTLFSLKNEISSNKYESEAYGYLKYVCKELINNRSFYSTVNNFRLSGNIFEIESFFNNVVGTSNAYKELIDLLDDLYSLIRKYDNAIFKNFILSKIKSKSNSIIELIKIYDNNCNYK